MKPLLLGANDTLDILAFKWRSIRSRSAKVWLVVVSVFAVGFLLLAGLAGSGLRLVLTSPSSTFGGSPEIQESLTLWVNIFLSNNASLAVGGVFWALLGSILIIPLVGYSFASIVPEGDLASIKVTDNHKISDSLMLQFVSTISFVQIIVLTVITSITTIGAPVPGLGIVFSWAIWLVSVALTVLVAWFFEMLFRKYGVKSKLIVFAVLLIVVGLIYLMFPKNFGEMFGIGEAYTLYLQNMSFANILPFLIGLAIVGIVLIGVLYAISFVASKTLKITERPKKRAVNKVFIAKIGLAEKNKVTSLTQFLANMVIRQNNIWKPLALSSVFAVIMAVVFYQFYDVLLTVSTLIPIMISLVWTINIFGIISAGTTWIVSLPYGKQKILSSIMKIQYVIVGGISFIAIGLVAVIYGVDMSTFITFIIATYTTTIVITQFSLHKAVYNPYRYRVHIRGESVLPPSKAFTYMIQLFVTGFAVSGLSYAVNNIASAIYGPSIGAALQLLVAGIITGIVVVRYYTLKRNWVADPEILQNIVKTVGQ